MHLEESIEDLFEINYSKLKNDSSIQLMKSFIGDLSEGMSYALTNNLENTLLESGMKKAFVRKIFSIVVEGLQNIRLHGEFDETGQKICMFLLFKTEDQFNMFFSNLIRTEHVDRLKRTIEEINALEKRELKETYLSVLNNGIMSKAGGAGLGILTMALKSQKNILVSFQKVNKKLQIVNLQTQISS